MKRMKQKVSAMEQSYLENYLEKERQSISREEQLRKELFNLEEENVELREKLQSTEEELKRKSEILRRNHLDAMEEQGRTFQRNHHGRELKVRYSPVFSLHLEKPLFFSSNISLPQKQSLAHFRVTYM